MRVGTSFSICLSDIPKDKIQVSEKNGKKYLNLNQFVDTEQESKYGTHGSITISQSKDEREAKAPKVYIGNATVYYSSEEQAKQAPVQQSPQEAFPNAGGIPDSDIPF